MGEFSGRDLLKRKKKRRWLKKSWRRKALKLKKKYDPLEGAHAATGIVIEKRAIEQKQPHSGLIKCVRIQLLKNGRLLTAFVPKSGAIGFIEEHDEVLVEGLGGSQRGQMGSIPGVRHKVIAVNGISLSELLKGKKEKPTR